MSSMFPVFLVVASALAYKQSLDPQPAKHRLWQHPLIACSTPDPSMLPSTDAFTDNPATNPGWILLL